MHELALADAVLEIVREHARGRRVTSVGVKVGRLRQVVPDALEFSFELLAAGTNVEGAALEIEHVPVRVECSRCGLESMQEHAAAPVRIQPRKCAARPRWVGSAQASKCESTCEVTVFRSTHGAVACWNPSQLVSLDAATP